MVNLYRKSQSVTNTPHKATTLPVASKDSLLRVLLVGRYRGAYSGFYSDGKRLGSWVTVKYGMTDTPRKFYSATMKNILISKCKLRRNNGFNVEFLHHGINMKCKLLFIKINDSYEKSIFHKICRLYLYDQIQCLNGINRLSIVES